MESDASMYPYQYILLMRCQQMAKTVLRNTMYLIYKLLLVFEFISLGSLLGIRIVISEKMHDPIV